MSGASYSSGAWTINTNTNTMNSSTMPSARAEAARYKAAEVMAALRTGEPGDADKAMGSMQAERKKVRAEKKERKDGKVEGGKEGTSPSTSWLGRKLSGMK